MKVFFLDIDGVVNSEETLLRGDAHGGILGIDKFLAFKVGRISLAVPDLLFVLSSSWRHFPEGRERVHEQVVPIFDITPTEPYYASAEEEAAKIHTQRGREIARWMREHPGVERYAIVDDDSDMLPEQKPNFFQTSWKVGITDDDVAKIIAHFA